MTHHKKNLPEKVCVGCGRPFAWRRKWEKVWSEVKYCSDRCRLKKPTASSAKHDTGPGANRAGK